MQYIKAKRQKHIEQVKQTAITVAANQRVVLNMEEQKQVAYFFLGIYALGMKTLNRVERNSTNYDYSHLF